MTDTPAPPLTLQVHCRAEVVVTDPEALVAYAVADLRDADIDWSQEEDDLDTAVEKLRADITSCLASAVDPGVLVEGVPGVEFRGGLCWAESGPAREPFHPPTP
ncbi:hypothetical protein ABT023_07375 [Micromonospora sp. NPDC002296]|uniref:hypothetical protein n=1 Tax=Micromonospora sp. NPDC002296 TaxID=3154271 RepID=UPI0033168EF5